MNGINKIRLITCGHKTFGVKWLFEPTTTHQLSATMDTKAAHSPKRFIPPSLYAMWILHHDELFDK